MPVTDAQVQALRAFLDRAVDEMPALAYQLGDAEIAGCLCLADAALSLLSCRRFPLYSNADVVCYVASVRRERLADSSAYDIAPVAGEHVMRSSPGLLDRLIQLRNASGLSSPCSVCCRLANCILRRTLTSFSGKRVHWQTSGLIGGRVSHLLHNGKQWIASVKSANRINLCVTAI